MGPAAMVASIAVITHLIGVVDDDKVAAAIKGPDHGRYPLPPIGVVGDDRGRHRPRLVG
ncbi:hypothetical protein CRG98_033757 [Punica granatum]|uniref:Uncharacterized protein n=1 Tax=Punica granatum TaxID=22663 RepID=A0A2I0IPD8_PUNGR|nr:hypothetical protein CRG98_033757 [Punica granatum]